MALIPEGTTPPPAEGVPQEPAAPAADGQPQTETAAERPDWLPEQLWGEAGFNAEAFESLAARPEPAADVPEAPDGYAIPPIEGLNAEEAAASPLVAVLRQHAHANGMGQAAFAQTLTDYVAAETARSTAYEAEQRTALGPNADARLRTLGTWLDSSLPADQAAAVRALTTDAAAVAGLEALMNARGAPRPRGDPPPAVVQETEADIRKLMQSPAYRGKPAERDPAVIARVDAFFAKQAAAKKA